MNYSTTKKRDLIEKSKNVNYIEFYKFNDNKNTRIHTDNITFLDHIDFDDLPENVRCKWDIMDKDEYNSTIYANCGEVQEDEYNTLVIVLYYGFKPLWEIAEDNELKIDYVTSDKNGFPKNLLPALVNFENWEQLEKIADEYGLTPVELYKKDGWHSWVSDGEAYRPIDIADYYSEFFTNNELSGFFENEVKPFLNDFDNFEDLEKFIAEKKEIHDEIEMLDDEEVAIVSNGRYYDTMKKNVMCLNYNSSTYKIGLM
jgi:hypothetical protein